MNPPSPTLETTHLPSGDAPPTPPNDLLDDIYGSAPSSPHLSHTTVLAHHHQNTHESHRDEILSDLPSRQRALDTDAYREGLSANKSEFVQEGFDEGYSLGANLGQRVGYILGVLQGLAAATYKSKMEDADQARYDKVNQLWEKATKELKIEELLGKEWVDEEGIWKWDVKGEEDEVTFREVAAQHPVIGAWMERVKGLAGEWGVDLERLEGRDEEGEQS